MITPCMLVVGYEHEGVLGTPEMDPLTEQGALQDAQLVEVMFDAVSRRLGWLLDLRMAFQLRMANTGLVVFEEVEGFGWVGKNTSVARVAWPVDDSIPNADDGQLTLKLLFYQDGETQVRAGAASFYTGDVADLPETPPDFPADSDEAIRAGTVSMDSPIELTQATFLQPQLLRGN
jgi:hypothetical protein